MTSVDQTAERTGSPPECEHPRVSPPRLLRLAGAGGLQYRRQCLVCGQPVGLAIAKVQAERNATGPIEDFDVELRVRGKEHARALAQAAAAERRAERLREYDAYLASDAWRAKRAAVLRRCGGICEGCGQAPAVEVHHLTYQRVGRELLFDLVRVCRACRDAVHFVEASLADWRERLGDLRELLATGPGVDKDRAGRHDGALRARMNG